MPKRADIPYVLAIGFSPIISLAGRLTLSSVVLGGLLGLSYLTLSLTAQSAETKSPTPSKTRFRFEAIDDKSLGLWEGERPVFVYNHGAISSAKAPNAQSRSTYLHPLYGLDGEILTDDFPKDHDYHRGLYWAWPHIKIDDQEYDSWSLRGIRFEFQRWLKKASASRSSSPAT